MGLVLDHIYVITPTRPEADAAVLEQAGLRVCRETVHEGQGTANICFCFEGAYLELLYITDESAVRSAAVRRTRLWERAHWQRTGVSPFGVCLRSDGADAGAWPVPTWAYGAPFLPAGGAIPIAEDAEGSLAPLLFFSVWPRRVETGTDRRRIAGVRIECPEVPRWNATLAGAAPFLAVERGDRHAMTVELGGSGGRGETVRLAGGLVTIRL